MDCAACGEPIPQIRLDALPDTITCMKCSRVRPKTSADIEVDCADPEELRDAVSGQENY